MRRCLAQLGSALFVLFAAVIAPVPPHVRGTGLTIQDVIDTLYAAHSYRVSVDYSIPHLPTSDRHASFVVVGRGAAPAFYVKVTSGNVVLEEAARQGQRACVKLWQGWTCGSIHAALFASVAAQSPTVVLSGVGGGAKLTPDHTRTVRGRRQTGYRFTGKASTGLLWVDVQTGHLVEEAGTDSGRKIYGQPVTLLITARVSQWNDPHLRVPSIPGL